MIDGSWKAVDWDFSTASSNIPLVTFDGKNGTSFEFTEDEDLVMGSESVGNWT